MWTQIGKLQTARWVHAIAEVNLSVICPVGNLNPLKTNQYHYHQGALGSKLFKSVIGYLTSIKKGKQNHHNHPSSMMHHHIIVATIQLLEYPIPRPSQKIWVAISRKRKELSEIGWFQNGRIFYAVSKF